ncbi:IcmF-related protein [hydrothermal vent metagenome]|uniref:IcmF-related protein n=1 Tax=hydrothermal vent metagenome TaxID=652676 RepID=A0A3B0WZI1_9ZZZZ
MQFILLLLSKMRYYLRILKPALKHLKNSIPVLVFIGFIALLVGIWWLGPKWEWDETYPLQPLMPRILFTVVLFLIAAVFFVFYSQKRLKASEEARLNDEEKDPITPYIEAQNSRFSDSMLLLKKNLEGHDYIYKLPWFLVIGGKGAGKTSLVNRSGQHFSFTTATKASSKNETGIRRRSDTLDLPYDIDWWMSNEAILIDPDGGLLLQQDSDEKKADLAPKLWQNFIHFLAKTRTRRPLNGVVLVVDLACLVNQKPSDRKAYAGILRARLRELMEGLGTQLPVYIVLSKFDLIKGFDVYFRGIKKSQRDDIFGITFKLEQSNSNQWLDELDNWYNQLLKMLNDHVFDSMSSITVLEDRESLFAFVRQLVGIKEGLQECLADILESDRFSTPAQVRGVYFSSVFQHGIPVNPFLESSARNYKVPLPVSSALPTMQAATYFVKPLFSQIIYPESGLAADNKKVVKQKRTISRIGAVVAGMGAIIMVAGFHFYYKENRVAVEQVLTAVNDYRDDVVDERIDETGRNLLPPLNHIHQASLAFPDYSERLPLISDFGLYQGKTIGLEVEEIYQQFLSKRFLPSIAAGVVEQMNATGYASDEKLMGLRVYRMIEDKDNRRKKVVTEWMEKLWQSRFPENLDVQKQLMVHLDYAMDHVGTDLPEFGRWVRDTQTELLTIPMPDRVYRTLKQNAAIEFSTPLDIRREIGPAFDVIYKHEKERKPNFLPSKTASFQATEANTPGIDHQAYIIDAMLTAPGFKDYFIDQNENVADLAMIDTWVLGMREVLDYSDEDKKELRQKIRELYIADYINTWNQSLKKLDINDFESIAHAVKILDTLSGATTPLQRLLKSIKKNSTIYAIASEKNNDVNTILQKDPNRKAAKEIQKSFAQLTKLLDSKDDNPAYIDEVLKSITSLHNYMEEIQEASNLGQKALSVAYDRFSLKGSDPISILNRVANGLPEPLNRQLAKVSEESWRVILIQALQELERKWDKDVYSFYQQHLQNRYPIISQGKDASLTDFTRFFAPDGILDTFYKEYLSLFMSSNLDVLSTQERQGLQIRADLAQQIEQAKRIQDAYFSNQGALHVPFSIEPIRLSGSQRKSVLNIDGQIISYDHGPAYPVDLLWPNSLQSRAESKLIVVSSTGNTKETRSRGAWSLFRLLDKGYIRPASNNSATLGFGARNRAMLYRIRGSGSNNPLTNNPLADFILPRYLLQQSQPGEELSEDTQSLESASELQSSP